MKTLQLVRQENPVLHQPAEGVGEITPEITSLIKKMKATLRTTTGVGLAAPQVGVGLQIFIMDVPQGGTPSRVSINGKTVALNSLRPFVLINPRVIGWGEKVTAEEGCLSLPLEGYIPVSRHHAVSVIARNEKGDAMWIEAEGFFARVIQHEADHLEGIMITSYREKLAPAA